MPARRDHTRHCENCGEDLDRNTEGKLCDDCVDELRPAGARWDDLDD